MYGRTYARNRRARGVQRSHERQDGASTEHADKGRDPKILERLDKIKIGKS